MEAESIEDKKIEFNVFIYNVQDGYTINYETGQATKTKISSSYSNFYEYYEKIV